MVMALFPGIVDAEAADNALEALSFEANPPPKKLHLIHNGYFCRHGPCAVHPGVFKNPCHDGHSRLCLCNCVDPTERV
jgi:hypothetical protein